MTAGGAKSVLMASLISSFLRPEQTTGCLLRTTVHTPDSYDKGEEVGQGEESR